MKKFTQVTLILSMAIATSYPLHDLVQDFVAKRNLTVQNTHYNFSKYLRYGS